MSKSFENFLREKHAKEYVGTDDDMADAFDKWLDDTHVDDVVLYAEEWHRQEMDRHKIDSIKNNEVHLCGSCCNEFPNCEDIQVIFGDGIGSDNIVACNKYEAITFRHPSQNGKL